MSLPLSVLQPPLDGVRIGLQFLRDFLRRFPMHAANRNVAKFAAEGDCAA